MAAMAIAARPVLDVAYGYLGFKVPMATTDDAEPDRPAEHDRRTAAVTSD